MRSAVIFAVTVLAFVASTTIAQGQNRGRGQGQGPANQQNTHQNNRKANRVLTVPEPGTLALIGTGVGALVAGSAWRLRRSNRKKLPA
jgi:PEP-CTERM motif